MRGNKTIVEMNCVNDFCPYVMTMEALKFKGDGPNLKLEDYQNHYLPFFDLTSMQESNVELYYPDIDAFGLRLKLYFSDNLKETVELVITGEKLSTNLIKKTEEITKHDSTQLAKITSQNGQINFKFLGFFPADMVPKTIP